MIERGRGTVLLSGATMALRGGSGFACMAPVKAALRSLGQSMFQEYAPKGIHVAHVVIDGESACYCK
jgi:short-subunit dehydrogenase